jgi:hypothetical protein
MTIRRTDEIRPEMQLLLYCARTRLGASHIERIRVLVRPDLNWATFLALADQHGLIPLVHQNLTNLSARIPDVWLERLDKAARSNAIRALYLGNELARILDVFHSNKITAIPYKGPVLAAQAYRDTALRQFDDLDIIVPQADLSAAHDAMLTLQYRARFPWKRRAETAPSRIPGEYTYRGQGQALVELHTEFTMRHFPVRPDISMFSGRLAQISVDGRNVPTFRAEDALAILCVHGAKDFWERLGWLVDLGALIQTSPQLDWDAVFATADALGARRMLLLGLSLAHELVEVPLSGSLIGKTEADPGVAALAALVRRKLTIEKQAWSALSRLRFRFGLVESRSEAVRYVWRLATAPAEDEWLGEDTSPFAARLQALARPWRLIRKHGATASHSEENPF